MNMRDGLWVKDGQNR